MHADLSAATHPDALLVDAGRADAARADDVDADPPEVLLALLDCAGPVEPRRRLLERCPDPAAIAALGSAGWRRAGLDPRQVAALRQPDAARIRQARDWLARPGCRLLHWGDPDYPPLLRQLPDAPLALWVQGDPALLWRPAVAVVGSRAATAGGCENARDFAAALAASGLVVVSGLARGIDGAAHRAALEAAGGLTVAVIGTGVDVAYPASHAGLQQQVAAKGSVVSELWPGSGPLAGHFPRRNRIIAGLTLAVLVVEAAERSGALITARLAGAAGREVLAIPGSIHNPQARGCLRLLREGAQLVSSPAEMLALLADQVIDHARLLQDGLGGPIHVADPDRGPIRTPADAPAPAVDPAYKRLWSALDFDPIPMDGLVQHSGLTVAEVSAMLPLMELEGRVRVEHGRYSRKR